MRIPITMAEPTHQHDELPPGHVAIPVALTGSMGIALAGGLYLLGMLEAIDRTMAGFVATAAEDLAPAISSKPLWIATAAISYGLALVMLEIPGSWRRAVIWISTMAVILAWLPIAAIAHQHAPIAAPLIAAAWAGLCTIIYAARHHMEADVPGTAADDSHPSDVTD